MLDSSALLAIMLAEADAEIFARAIADSNDVRISAANYLESSIVYASRVEPDLAYRRVDAFISELAIMVEPVTAMHVALAREGHQRFGKGRHPAALNLGDCFAYALAKTYSAPLLFKGDDFTKTDIKAAI